MRAKENIHGGMMGWPCRFMGGVYFGNDKGTLLAVDTGNTGLLSSPWPRINGDNQNTRRVH